MKPNVFVFLICVIGFLLLAYNPIGGQMIYREWMLLPFAIGGVLSFFDVLD